VFFDYDRDGLLDLYLCNVGVYTTDQLGSGGYYVGVLDAFGGHLKPERTERSILYRNLGGRRFQDVTEEVGLVDDAWTGDASPMDLNEDGFPDLYVLNMQGHDQYYENAGGTRFSRKTRAIFPKTPWGSMGIGAFDFDNDGDMDVMVTDMHSDMSEEVGLELEKLKSHATGKTDELVSAKGEMELDGRIVGKFGKGGKALGEFATTHQIDCRNPDILYTAEINNWRSQKIILKPQAMKPSGQ